MTTYALVTLGCKVNQYEGEAIRKGLFPCRQVDFGRKADVYIINSCGVTAEAEAKARQLIRRARKTAPDSFIVFTGCYRDSDAEPLRGLGVDLLVPNADKERLAEILAESGIVQIGSPDGEIAADAVHPKRSRTFVKVQDGCDQFCSYCAVPDFRGAPTSRRPDEVISEIDSLVAGGFSEVVLSGIHIGKYGVDFSDRTGLDDLIELILENTGVTRLRLSSVEPREVSDRLLDMIAGNERLADHLHLPLQSGSDRILKSMNRPYSLDDFRGVVERARSRLLSLGLTTDVIVGFPGETDEDFDQTISAINEFGFGRTHVFKFSERPGTPAASMAGKIDGGVKTDRAAKARAAAAGSAARFAASWVGREVRVLAEPVKNGAQTGLTGEYVRVQFIQAVGAVGSVVPVLVERSEGDVLFGRIADE